MITSAGLVDGMQVQVMRDETELEAVRRARDSMLANISHEFRTPLAAQQASIELLRDGLADMPREKLEELVDSLQRGTLRLTRLIDNLLESVRIESGQLGIRRQPVELAQVVEDAQELIAGLLAQRRQPLRVELPADLPLVQGDAQRLTQVLTNLLANANKFAPEGSEIVVGAARAGDERRRSGSRTRARACPTATGARSSSASTARPTRSPSRAASGSDCGSSSRSSTATAAASASSARPPGARASR